MKLKPIFIQQQGPKDCGVACLLSAIRMHGGDAGLETLRLQSGTNLQGTSLLGLQQCAQKQNLHAEVFEVDDIEVFKEQATFPCILHVVIEDKMEHYVLCYEISDHHFFIVDPAKGLDRWDEQALLRRWKSRAVILIEPDQAFEKIQHQHLKKISWLKDLLREDIPLLITAAVLGILIAALGMGMSVFTQKLVDEIIPQNKFTKLWTGLGLVTILLIVRSALNYLRSVFLIRQSKDFNNRLMDDFYEKLLHLPKTFFDNRKTGEIIARLSDTRRIQTVISFLAGNVIIDILIFLVSTGFLFFYSRSVALLSLLSIPMIGGMIFYYHQKIIAAQRMVMSQYATTESFFVDTIGGIGTIKSANKEPFFLHTGKTIYSFFQEQISQLGQAGAGYGLINELINTLMIAAILTLTSYQVLQKDLKLGEMMAILSISTGMLLSLSKLATTNIQIQEARVALDRVFEFAGIEPEPKEEVIPNGNLKSIETIEIKNMSFRFPGKGILLKNISLTLEKGELAALTGEVGSGKSMILQVLQKFQEYENGQIMINSDVDFKDVPVKEWRSMIGVIQQEIKIFNGTILENILLGNPSGETEKVISFCRNYGFSYFFEQLPQSYFTIVGEDGVKLSGGQKQLVALARALFHDPEVLLLDEPTSAMDKKTETFVMHLLETLKANKIILMVSHRDSLSKYMDKTYILNKGEILSDFLTGC
jgi:ABC-type bacteriocin/lantibiotic exporter with double-glycine peptidase domain